MTSHDRDLHDRSTDEIEREIESDRTRLARTLSTLEHKLSINGMVEKAMESVTRDGGDLARSFGDSAKRNPLSLLLVGAGVASMFMGDRSGRRRDDDYGRDREHDRFGADGFDDFGARDLHGYRGRPSSDDGRGLSETLADKAAAARNGAAGLSSSARGAAGEAAGSIRDKASGAAESARGAASSAAGGVSDAASRAGDRASAAAGSVRDAARDGGRYAADTFYEGREALGSSLEAARRRAAHRARRASDQATDLFEDNPLMIGALAFAAGAAIGALSPNTRIEDDWMGEPAERARSAVRDRGASAADAARAQAEKAAARGLDAAEDGARAAASSAKKAAADIAGAAKEGATSAS